MAKYLSIALVCGLSLGVVISQRSPYAGRRPIGYPEMEEVNAADALGNRFGDGTTTTKPTGPTERLPVEALGDRTLVERLSRLPLDKQPFWYINWRALEANRNNPQTFAQRPNTFIDPIQPSNQQLNNQQSNSISNARLRTNQLTTTNSQFGQRSNFSK